MTDKCYPIKIENTDEQYYVIYNLEECRYLNKEKALFNEEPHFFLGKEITTPLSCVTNTLFVFVTEEVKQCLIENKISNIFFREDYLCTEKEYRDWQINRINL